MKTLLFIPVLFLLLASCGKMPEKSNTAGTSALETAATCADIYAPVCAQPPMPVCPVGESCVQVMPAPKTYQNDCLMYHAGATLLQSGSCP